MLNPLNPMKMDREDEKRMLPCRDFMEGYCDRGNRCRYYHPSGGANRAVIKVPPLPANFGSGVSLSSLISPSQSAGNLNGTRSTYHPTSNAPRARGSLSSTSNISRGGHSHSNSQSSGLNFGHHNRNGRSRNYNPPDCGYSNSSCSPSMSTSSDLSIPAGEQNTVFTHIDWREFMAPGLLPPPPIRVIEASMSADEDTDAKPKDQPHPFELQYALAPNEDLPPEGSNMSVNTEAPPRKLTPKEELQMKVKQLAQEISIEPKNPLCFDSYFLNYDFEGNGFSPIPSSMKLHNPTDQKKGYKENEKGEDNARPTIAESIMESKLVEESQNKSA